MPAGVSDSYSEEIGGAILRARKELGMSQEDLRLRIGKSKNTISSWERGASAPTVESLRTLCYALNVAPESLLGMGQPAGGAGQSKAARRARKLGNRIDELRQHAEHTVPNLIDGLREIEREAKGLSDDLL